MQTFLMVLVIVVLMAPLLLVYGIPFIVPAIVLHAYTALWLSERTRLVLACGIASLGIAPGSTSSGLPRACTFGCSTVIRSAPWLRWHRLR